MPIREDSFSVTVRLMWIDGVIDNDGCINRADISRAFGVSIQQASIDLRRYMELNPGRIGYDVRQKHYALVEGTKPLFSGKAQEAAAEIVRCVDGTLRAGGA